MTLHQKRESETWYRKSNRPPRLSLQPNFVLRNIKSICNLFLVFLVLVVSWLYIRMTALDKQVHFSINEFLSLGRS